MPEVRAGAQPAEAVPQRPPRLIPGCCAYSYGELLEPGKMTMEEVILKAVELEVVGVDMTAYWLKSTEPAYLHGLRRLAFRHGIAFSGAACGVEMCEPDAGKRTALTTEITKWVDAADLLGASHLRVFGGVLPHGATAEQGKDWVVEVMKPACEYAARKGVTLGMESHGGITGKAANVIDILRRVDSPYAGCNLDITHFREDQYNQIEALIPYATMTHIRDHFDGYPPPPIDLDRVWQMFAKAGYQGYMAAEYEAPEQAPKASGTPASAAPESPLTAVPRLVAKIKTLCKKYSSV